MLLAGFLVPLGLSGGAEARPLGSAAATLVLGAAGNPLVVHDESGQVRGGVERALSGRLDLQVGVGLGFEALASVVGETRTVTADEAMTLPGGGSGDARLGFRFTPFGGPLSVRALAGPVSREGDTDLTYRESLGEHLIVAVSGGYRHREREQVYDAVWDDALTWAGGAEVPLAGGLSATSEVRGEVGLSGSGSPAEWLVGGRYAHGDVGVGLAGGTGIGQAPGSPAWRVELALTFAPRTHAPVVVARAPLPEYREKPFEETLAEITPEEEPERDPDASAGLDLIDEETPNVKVVKSEILLEQAVFFELNRKRVRTPFRPILDELAVFLARHPEVARIQVEGHADSSGPPEWNHELSLLRAREVCAYLMRRGIAAERLDPVPFGASRPWADNDTGDGRARNRRVVFTVTEVK